VLESPQGNSGKKSNKSSRRSSVPESHTEAMMLSLEELLQLVLTLSPQEREQLLRALGAPAPRGPDLPLASPAAAALSRPDVRDPIGWRKAEAGHAVLAFETPERDDDIPTGPRAIAGMWAEGGDR
jgi:hypothetical protein